MKEKATKRAITMEDLAGGLTGLSKAVGTLTTTVDNLAASTARGFESVENRFEVIEKRLAETATKDDIGRLGQRMFKLEENQLDIKLRLDNAAYRYEVDELKKRVNKIEHKVGLSK